MPMPTLAKSQNLKGLDTLADLGPGRAVHYCMVRLGGKQDKVVHTLLAETSARATRQKFKLAWSGDEEVAKSTERTWFVARGAFIVATPKGEITTVPSLRDNRVVAAAEVKSLLKAARDGLKDGGLVVTPLQKAIGGKIARAADTTRLGLNGDEPEPEDDDEAELVQDKGTEAVVVALVKRFKACKLKSTVATYTQAKTEGGDPSAQPLEDLRDTLSRIAEEAAAAEASFKKKVLGSTRFGDSLKTLGELGDRARTAIGSIDKLLTGVDLATASSTKVDDTILKTLRGLTAKLKTALPEAKIAVLTDMYFAADMWLKVAGEGSAHRKFSNEIEQGMVQKVQEVYGRICKELAAAANVPINHLPRWLEETQGKGMERHGTELDVERELAQWMTANQRNLFRVHVKGGKLYQYDWWEQSNFWDDSRPPDFDGGDPGKYFKLKPVESARGSSDAIRAGYSGFVMSMSGDVYMTRQDYKYRESAIYHSSYMAGLPVLMAGELLVKGGAVKRVNTASGHYRPPPVMVVRFLKMLQLQGIKVEEVADHADENPVSADAFLASHGDEVPDAEANRKNEIEMARYRQQVFFSAFSREVDPLKALVKEYKRFAADLKRVDQHLLGVLTSEERLKVTESRKELHERMGRRIESMKEQLKAVDFVALELRLKKLTDKHESDKAERVKQEREQTSGIRRIDVPDGADDGYTKGVAKVIANARSLKLEAEQLIATHV